MMHASVSDMATKKTAQNVMSVYHWAPTHEIVSADGTVGE